MKRIMLSPSISTLMKYDIYYRDYRKKFNLLLIAERLWINVYTKYRFRGNFIIKYQILKNDNNDSKHDDDGSDDDDDGDHNDDDDHDDDDHDDDDNDNDDDKCLWLSWVVLFLWQIENKIQYLFSPLAHTLGVRSRTTRQIFKNDDHYFL